ncbi:MAG: ECF transporter S component [Candidatus Fermentithermobacillus carboniphilus]|uniref:ECF transporter S component n=1 Tax=Candidatus Fermentithermobacillus carboniphilus TaxID=3085328 RepID=A0AAT9LB77_9FIRM|nr:MAG: ECF transporter S component [Candidatus Fermentithermobacillus carboniphilus]
MKLSARRITLAGVLGAITVVLGLLPVGGFIPVPTPAGSATTMHIPTILAGVLEGPLVGAIVGAIFGGFSFWKAQVSANPVERLIFTNPLIAFVPRILIGVVSYYVFSLARGKRGRLALGAVAFLLLGYVGYWLPIPNSARPRLILAVLAGSFGAFIVYLINRRSENPGPGLGAVAGSLVNTAGVLGLSVAFGYLPYQAAVAVAVMHGVPEALVALVLSDLIYRSTGRFFHEPR